MKNRWLFAVALAFMPLPSAAQTLGPPPGITVGSTAISSGGTTRVLYDNAGTIGEYTLSGTGSVCMTTSCAMTTPNLGTPSAAVLTNATGLPISTGLSGAGTGVLTALGINVGSAGAIIVNGGVLGTPSSGTLTNATGLPISTGVSGLGAGVATLLGGASSGTGGPAGITSPSFTTPTLGVASGTSLALNGCVIGTNALCTTGTANISGAMTLGGALISAGSVPVGTTGSCSASSFAGGALAGRFTAPACAAGTIILSSLPTAPNGYACDAQDQTTSADTLKQTANTTTSATFTATTAANDIVAFKCMAF